ncbi:alpha/beta hydrolase [bacterium]|nr:alpha/beta hydrolase [bacterium]
MKSSKGIYYIRRGAGKKIVLIHGWMSNHRIWKDLISTIDKNYEIILLDLMGFGNSARIQPKGSYLDYLTESTFNFINEICGGDIHAIISHSMGGIITLKMIKEYSLKMDKVVICGAPFNGLSGWVKILGSQPKLTEFAFKQYQKFPMALKIKTSFIAKKATVKITDFLDEDYYLAAAQSDPKYASTLFYEMRNRTVSLDFKDKMPQSYICRGEFDLLAKKTDLETLSKFSNANYKEFPLSGHMPMIETKNSFNEYIKEIFLQ